jgi:hypothetical protein
MLGHNPFGLAGPFAGLQNRTKHNVRATRTPGTQFHPSSIAPVLVLKMYIGAPSHKSQQAWTESTPVNPIEVAVAATLDETEGVDITEMLETTPHCTAAEGETSNGEYLMHVNIDTQKGGELCILGLGA